MRRPRLNHEQHITEQKAICKIKGGYPHSTRRCLSDLKVRLRNDIDQNHMAFTIQCPHCGVSITYGREEMYTSAKSTSKQCPNCKQWALLVMADDGDVKAKKK
jgi:hypothetical protein